MKSVSVVVCTYAVERFGYVLDCVRSLKKQTVVPEEIILVLDPQRTLIDFYKENMPQDVRIVISEGFGLSNARNTGVRNAKGEIIAFIDDDAHADENWLETLVRNYNDNHIVGVGGLVKPVWECDRPAWFPEELNWLIGCSYKGLPNRRSCVRNPIGCSMSFRRQVFDKIGFFNTGVGRISSNLVSGEETELSIRVLEGLPSSRIVYDPAAIVYHKVQKTRMNLGYLLKRSFHEGFSIALIVNSTKPNRMSILSVEKRYLKYLLNGAIPSRFKRLHALDTVCQLLALLLSIFLVLMGYLTGRCFRKS